VYFLLFDVFQLTLALHQSQKQIVTNCMRHFKLKHSQWGQWEPLYDRCLEREGLVGEVDRKV